MITFKPFREFYSNLRYPDGSPKKRGDLITEAGLSSETANKVWTDRNITLEILDRICRTYELQVHQVVQYIEDKPSGAEHKARMKS